MVAMKLSDSPVHELRRVRIVPVMRPTRLAQRTPEMLPLGLSGWLGSASKLVMDSLMVPSTVGNPMAGQVPPWAAAVTRGSGATTT